jgi:zinc transport system substrate-binding protein
MAGWRRETGLAAAIAAALVAGGCGAASSPAPGTPTIQVVTGLYPLAQALQQIGGSTVTVTDVVPSGVDPFTYQLTPAQVSEVHHAALVVEVGELQPGLDTAASGGHNQLDLKAALATSDSYLWLDPDLMTRAVAAIAVALEGANPPAAHVYQSGAQAFAVAVASTGIDYESTLSTCPRRTFATADGAFVGLAQQYGLTDQVLGTATHPDPATVASASARVAAAGLTTVFSEPFVPAGTVQAVAAAAHVKVRVLDPLAGPPPAGWPRRADYLQLMEANLGALNSALGCPDTSTGV